MKYLKLYQDLYSVRKMEIEAETQKKKGSHCLIYQGWLWRSLLPKDVEDVDFMNQWKSNIRDFNRQEVNKYRVLNLI